MTVNPTFTKLQLINSYENPGFVQGETVYWDRDALPPQLQPRPNIGRIVSIATTGCYVQKESNARGFMLFPYEYLCTYGLVLR
jgi:hypothetical protein